MKKWVIATIPLWIVPAILIGGFWFAIFGGRNLLNYLIEPRRTDAKPSNSLPLRYLRKRLS